MFRVCVRISSASIQLVQQRAYDALMMVQLGLVWQLLGDSDDLQFLCRSIPNLFGATPFCRPTRGSHRR